MESIFLRDTLIKKYMLNYGANTKLTQELMFTSQELFPPSYTQYNQLLNDLLVNRESSSLLMNIFNTTTITFQI